MNNKAIAPVATVLVVLALGFAGCRPGPEAEVEEHSEEAAASGSITLTPEAVRTAGIRSARAELLPVVRTVRAPGEITLDPRRRAHITARTSGRIEGLAAYPGDRVRAGQTVLSLYSPDFLLLQEELLLAAARRKRPADDPAEKASSEGLWASIKDRLRVLGLTDDDIAGIDRNGVPMPLLPVRAPISGVVVEGPAMAGDQVELGTSLLRVADMSMVRAVLRISEKDLASVRVGAETVLRAASAPGREFKGRIFRLGNAMDPGTRTLEALIDLPNPDGELRQGLYIEAEIALPSETTALFVPESAVLEIGDRKIVFVLSGENVFTLREVAAGPVSDGRIAIASGLAVNEVVVSAGSFLIKSELLKKTFGEDEHGHD